MNYHVCAAILERFDIFFQGISRETKDDSLPKFNNEKNKNDNSNINNNNNNNNNSNNNNNNNQYINIVT